MKLNNDKVQNIEGKILFFLKIIAIIIYLCGFFYQIFYFRIYESNMFFWDQRCYFEFTTLRPIYITGEEAYMVLYQPFFIWLWYPMTFFDLKTTYYMMFCINFPSLLFTLFNLLPKLNKVDKHLEKIALIIYCFAVYEHGRWLNIEFFISMIYLYLWTIEIKNTKQLMIHSFIASICSFKVLSLVFIPIFAQKSKRFFIYMFSTIFFLIILNIYWVIQYPYIIDIYWLIYAFKHGGYTYPIFLLNRTSFSIPLIWLIYIGIKKLLELFVRYNKLRI